jgi:hypothetical protein
LGVVYWLWNVLALQIKQSWFGNDFLQYTNKECGLNLNCLNWAEQNSVYAIPRLEFRHYVVKKFQVLIPDHEVPQIKHNDFLTDTLPNLDPFQLG